MICLHDRIVQELVEEKSLAALIYLICHGRELELEFGGKLYFISRDRSERYASLWDGHNEQSFDSVDALIENAKLEDKTFLSAWKLAKIQTLF